MTTATATPNTTIATLLHQLRFARGGVEKLLDGIPADKVCTQAGAGANHALWIAGHLASTDDFILTSFGKLPTGLPETWQKLFGMGAKPTSNPKDYPAYAEVLKAFKERRTALEKWFTGLSAADLAKPSPDDWKPYAPTTGDLAFFTAWHEGYHGGQLSVLRRGLGLAPAFG